MKSEGGSTSEDDIDSLNKIYDVTIRYEGSEVDISFHTKKTLEEDLNIAFKIALQTMKNSMSKKQSSKKKSTSILFRRCSAEKKDVQQSATCAITEDEMENVSFQIEWKKPRVAVVIVTFRKEKHFYKKWFKKAMDDLCRISYMGDFSLI